MTADSHSAPPAAPRAPTTGGAQPDEVGQRVVLPVRVVWRSGLILLGVVALGAFGRFVLTDAGGALFTLLAAWFAAITMEPAIRKLSPHMSRGKAALLVMAGVALFAALFTLAFGRLLLEQVAQLLGALPGLVEALIQWVNRTFSTSYVLQDVQAAIKLTPQEAAGYADDVLRGGILFVGHTLIFFFNVFTALFLIYYLAADGPRLRLWLAGLLPDRLQRVFVTTWDLTTIKTGGYVAARIVLATISGGASAVVFWFIGMPYWLALGVWTGLIAQFVPTIGTYISIALPVLVGLLSPDPWIGVAALVWAVIYQQIENVTIEPRISAKAVDVHPAVGFASVMVGTALFGVAGALLSIPVAAVLLALMDIYVRRHELLPDLETRGADARDPASGGPAASRQERRRGVRRLRRRVPDPSPAPPDAADVPLPTSADGA
jgi:predicted PurR-regulated permease PerM